MPIHIFLGLPKKIILATLLCCTGSKITENKANNGGFKRFTVNK